MQIFRKSHIKRLAEDLKQYQIDKDLLKTKSVAYFVGITGSGKSTIINHLLGHPLKVIKQSGVRHVVLMDKDGPNKPLIGTSLSISCTLAPQLFLSEQYQQLLLCDTAGYADQGPLGHNCELLNEMYLTMAQQIAAIIFVINIEDLRSGRGGGFSPVFEELKRISNFTEVQSKMLFIINLKSCEESEMDELFQDVFLQLKQMKQQTLSNKSTKNFTQQKIMFYETIFNIKSPNQEVSFQKFKQKVMICNKAELTSKDGSILRKTFFSRVLDMKGKQTLHLNPSKGRIQLTKHIIRGILSFQSQLEQCISKFELYKKSKIIEVNFWNRTEVEENPSIVSRAKILSTALFSNDIDNTLIDELISKLDTQIKQFQHTGHKLFRSCEFSPDISYFQSHNEISLNIHLGYQIKTIVKILVGFKIQSESMDLKLGKYEAKFVAIPQYKSQRKLNVLSVTSYEDRDRDMIQFLKLQKSRFQNKKLSKGLLQSLPLQDQLKLLLDTIIKTKDQTHLQKFINKYSLGDSQMFRSLPSINDFRLYQSQLMIYRMIISNIDVDKQCINLVFLDRLKKNSFLKFQNQKGYCAINYHLIKNLVRLQCGHEYDEFCWNRHVKKSGKQSETECIICKSKKSEVQVSELERTNYLNKFKKQFQLKAS